MPSLLRRVSTMLIVVLACIGCDQGTKRLAVLGLKGQDGMAFLGHSVRLLYAENTGAWGSLGEGWPEPWKAAMLVAMPLFVLAILVTHVLRKDTYDRSELLGYALVLGGGLGNIIDRLTHGYVVDFMYVGVGRIGTNIFNVADVAVVVGVGILALGGMMKRKPAPAGIVNTGAGPAGPHQSTP